MPGTTVVSKDTNWRVPYRGWTAQDLIISNQLRDHPLPVSDLVLFQHHKETSIRHTYHMLRASGRLSADNDVVLDHPENLPLAGSPKLLPLPDPGARPITRAKASEQHTAATMAIGLSDAEPLDRKQAAALLSNWITSGRAGKDTPRFMDSWLTLVGAANESGPPIPLLPSEQAARLLRLLLSVPRSVALSTIRLFEEHHANLLNHRETALGHGPASSSPAAPPDPTEGMGQS